MSLTLQDHIQLLSAPDPVMLVSVAEIKGSTPREVGAFMLITSTRIAGTIGGGNLEHQVTQQVRAAFVSDSPVIGGGTVKRFPLGPGLGQCCGGSVEVGFHLLDTDRKSELREMLKLIIDQPVSETGRWLMLPVGAQNERNQTQRIAQANSAQARMLGSGFGVARGGVVSLNGAETLCLRLDEALTPIWIFGAGHVGKAVIQALAPLPFDVHLVDSREEYLDLPERKKQHIYQSDRPEQEVVDIPSAAHVLILTHNHALDFDICRAALMRDDLGFVGMIGSKTKRARFVRRLFDRGLGAAEIGRLTCPIGLQGITGKQPVIIAASVAAQVLSVREAQMVQSQPTKSASDGIG